MRTFANDRAATSVNGDERADGVSAGGERRRRAKPTLAINCGGAKTCTSGAQREGRIGRRSGGKAQIPIRGKTPPILVSTVAEIEQHGTADQRHAHVSNGEAAAALAQMGRNPRAGIKP